MSRPLTIAQHARLDRLAKTEPDALVVGWDTRGSGPLIHLTGSGSRSSSLTVGSWRFGELVAEGIET